MKLPLPAALALPVLAAPAAAQTTWTVDDDGPADFATVAAAVAAASGGDTILVENGGYPEALTITEPLTILGRPGFFYPSLGPVTVTDAGRVVLQHLGTPRLVLTGLAERSLVDDCIVTGDGTAGAPAMLVEACVDLRVSDTRVTPTSTNSALGAPGTRVGGGARVTFVGCELRGGDSGFLPPTAALGGDGLTAVEGARLLLAGTRVTGGTGFDGAGPGTGGLGLVAEGAGTLIEVRGSVFDGIYGGFSGDPVFGDRAPSTAIQDATVVLCDVTVQPAPGPEAVEVAARPYMETLGGAQPGAQRPLGVLGPAGAPAVIALGLPAFEPLFEPLLGLPAGVDLTGELLTFQATLVGQDLPAGPFLTNPADPSFAGTWLEAQALVVDGGVLLATNSTPVLLGF
jgi:hypothetical protein